MVDVKKGVANMPNKTLDLNSKQKLTKAYMNLYDVLVSAYQSKHMTLGRSWYNAMDAIDKILDAQSKTNSGVAMDFVLGLHKSHQNTEPRKMMESTRKDDIVDIQNTPQIESAIVRLNQALNSCETVEVPCTISQPGAQFARPKTFDNWLDNLPSKDIQDLETNPRAFEKIYRKYIFSRKQK